LEVLAGCMEQVIVTEKQLEKLKCKYYLVNIYLYDYRKQI
jgi:hypothetical protein